MNLHAAGLPGLSEMSVLSDAPNDLTTAETLVLEVVITHLLLGAGSTTFSHRLWLRPQLERLAGLGLVTWAFDENADFVATATPRLELSVTSTSRTPAEMAV
jgi:hypothetical protein